jgi:hypothetical protein
MSSDKHEYYVEMLMQCTKCLCTQGVVAKLVLLQDGVRLEANDFVHSDNGKMRVLQLREIAFSSTQVVARSCAARDMRIVGSRKHEACRERDAEIQEMLSRKTRGRARAQRTRLRTGIVDEIARRLGISHDQVDRALKRIRRQSSEQRGGQ